jgi:uncharacterized membrane protein YfcA
MVSGPAVAALIGCMLIVLVPARRLLRRHVGTLPPSGFAAASAGYGLMVGGTAGSGVFLISILLAAGLTGSAVIATDAGVSVLLGAVKSAVFLQAGYLPFDMWVMALLIGICAIPGAFVARKLTYRLSDAQHVLGLDGVVVLGGVLIVIEALAA